MSITAILFDLDGTLVKHGHVLLPPVLNKWGYPRALAEVEAVVEAELRWVYGETIKAGEWTAEIIRDWQTRILRGLNIPDADGERVQQLLDFYRTDPVPPLYDDVKGLLEQLRTDGFRLGIITQRGRKGTETFLTEHGIGDHFETVVCGNDGHGRKPTPGPFLASIEQLGCAPERAIFIGDRIDDDCEGALGAGLGAFLIDRYERFRNEAQNHERITYLSSLDELVHHL